VIHKAGSEDALRFIVLTGVGRETGGARELNVLSKKSGLREGRQVDEGEREDDVDVDEDAGDKQKVANKYSC